MAWSGSLTSSSTTGSSITFTPDTTTTGAYTVSSFTAPIQGVYEFQLKGSGGYNGIALAGSSSGGAGGYTVGYLALKADEVVYIGAGGTCSAAFVTRTTGTKLAEIKAGDVYFVAGAGGAGGSCSTENGLNAKTTAGGVGGGETGGTAPKYDDDTPAGGGTRFAGGTSGYLPLNNSYGAAGIYGVGASIDVHYNEDQQARAGRGGDGFYGGGSGTCYASSYGSYGLGGGGGSGYVRNPSLTVSGTKYSNTTEQGTGAEANSTGSVVVTYIAEWDGSLTSDSELGSSVTYFANTTTARAYTVDTFTATKKGIYRFQLYGSGGSLDGAGTKGTPGAGGYTDGYLLLEAGDTVYVGCGGYRSAAFVSKVTGATLSAISESNLYFVAGAGGGNGAAWDNSNGNWGGNGGAGGGASGGDAPNVGSATGGKGGSQTAGGSGYKSGSYGVGADGGYNNVNNTSQHRGHGGDGYYGGGSGNAIQANGAGGGGGSGYIYQTTLSTPTATYTNTTTQGAGAPAAGTGYVVVTYYALAELPVVYNGTRLTKIIYNGQEITSLIYNGTKLF